MQRSVNISKNIPTMADQARRSTIIKLACAGYVLVRRHREVARPSEVDRLRRVQALGRGQRGRPKRQVLRQRQV